MCAGDVRVGTLPCLPASGPLTSHPQGSPLPPTFDLQLKRGSAFLAVCPGDLWGQPDEEGRRRPGVRDGRAWRPLLLWLFLCGSPSGCKVSATLVSLISQQREDQTRLLRFGWKPPGRGVAPSPSTWARGPGRAPLGSPPWCWGGDGRGHPGGRGQGGVHPGHRPPEALGTFPHGLIDGYRATPASPRRDVDVSSEGAAHTQRPLRSPVGAASAAVLGMWPPLGAPPLRPFPVSSGAAASCFPRRSHLLSVPPSILHLVLWSPRRAQRPLEKDRAAATNGSCCPVAGGHACTNVPAPGRRPPRSRRARVRRCGRAAAGPPETCAPRIPAPVRPTLGPAVCQQPRERHSSLFMDGDGVGAKAVTRRALWNPKNRWRGVKGPPYPLPLLVTDVPSV